MKVEGGRSVAANRAVARHDSPQTTRRAEIDASKRHREAHDMTQSCDNPPRIRASAARPSLPACDMPDEPEAPRRHYQLKPKEFERLNETRPQSEETATPVPPANDVFALQQQLREREIAAGMDELAPPDRPRPNRRRRDYWLLMVLINGTLLPLAFWGLRTGNAVLAIYALSGAVFTTLAVTWIIWVLLDRY